MKHREGAVILGGAFIGLGCARALRAAGVRVVVVDPLPCLARFSNTVEMCLRAPDPSAGQAALATFLHSIAAQHGLAGAVLFPTTEDTTRFVAENAAGLQDHFHLTTPPWSVTRLFCDKRLTLELAERTQVPMPATFAPGSGSRAAEVDLRYPAVIKPATTSTFLARTGKKAIRVDSRSEMLAVFAAVARVIDPAEILIQELVPGGPRALASYFGYLRGGRFVVGGSALRPRQYPMDFGRASTLAVTASIPDLRLLAERLFSGTGFTGVSEVEFMYDSVDSRYELLEVNPRFWGWHTLAFHAGVNLPYIAYLDALGRLTGEDVGTLRDGVRWTRTLADPLAAGGEIVHRRLSLRDYVRSLGGAHDAVASLRDPKPFFAEPALLVMRKRRRRI